jgi:hypothetical protein
MIEVAVGGSARPGMRVRIFNVDEGISNYEGRDRMQDFAYFFFVSRFFNLVLRNRINRRDIMLYTWFGFWWNLRISFVEGARSRQAL